MTTQSDIREQAMNLPRMDTHTHFDGNLPDLRDVAAGFENAAEEGNLVNSRTCAEGCRKLHSIDPGLLLRPDAPPELFHKADALRALGPAKALEAALDADNITNQLAFVGHSPEASPLVGMSPRLGFLAYIDEAVAGNGFAFCPDRYDYLPHMRETPFCYYDAICGHFGNLSGLDDYLDALDACVDSWRTYGVVGMKTAFAYTIGLDFSDPSRDDARAAFARKRDMTQEEVTAVQHFAFRHALLACKRNELPVVVHTGFQIWGHSDLRQSNPMHLHNLLIDDRYKDLTFVLLHGGNPYTGETTYLARMFPSVIIDFTWIAWMTRSRFRMAFAEWLEIVPHNRFCWGSDSGFPENIVGIGRIVREEIGGVLEDLMARRILDERTALDFLRLTYQDTPRRVFGV